jgi:uncharacterized SAM-binding protein YcdF (DUF218 family)
MWIMLKIASEILLPPNGLVFLACLGIVSRRRFPRFGLSCGITAIFLAILLSIPILGWWLDQQQPHLVYAPPSQGAADAIVVLGGGRREFAAEYGQEITAGVSTLERLRYTAKVARELKTPILVSGGAPMWGAAQPEADIMRDVLVQEYGLPVQWVERSSNDTLENAKNSAAILLPAGVKRIYLITHATHMPRAQANFEAQGFLVVPLATVFTPHTALSSWYFIPSFEGLADNRARIINLVASLRS